MGSVLAVLTAIIVFTGRPAAPPDWRAVEQALGSQGSLQAGLGLRWLQPDSSRDPR
jgi:hypothetical protein